MEGPQHIFLVAAYCPPKENRLPIYRNWCPYNHEIGSPNGRPKHLAEDTRTGSFVGACSLKAGDDAPDGATHSVKCATGKWKLALAPEKLALAPEKLGFAPERLGFASERLGIAPERLGLAPERLGFARIRKPATLIFGFWQGEIGICAWEACGSCKTWGVLLGTRYSWGLRSWI